ncbi:energy-coupling factor ABC transporter ATP-binding protein [Desulfovibrio sp. JC022]|uniref:energy-coupling factor ABC transporter ATP-binding protein n=1 Tax=Desulfovibrio sp. JC022 TaxID=2593642 RepID=UPI0013D24603|nr:ABC transporter ATP-binding protein [Desulfovibrio sp. JC022]NDV22315.1 ABC transporter ATP-binding protein [Desulfovibrio sp. JC022]
MSLIEIEKFSYRYGASSQLVLNKLNLRIAGGEFVAVIGANNSGKSTLCNVLTGAVPQLYHGLHEGRVRICGKDTAEIPASELAGSVAFVMQNPKQQLSGIRFTVAEEVAFSLENMGLPRENIRQHVDKALALTGMLSFADRSPHHLSGGQLQKVTLAAALACDTRIIVLDEPTTFLDPLAAKQVFEILFRLRQSGKTVVLAEQRLENIALCADRVIALHEGEIVLDGLPNEVLASPLLKDIGLDVTRFSKVAELAKVAGCWREEQELATTFDGVLEGLIFPAGGFHGN